MRRTLLTLAAGTAALFLATAARADVPGPRLSGEFDVFWVNCSDSNTARSQATIANFHDEFMRAQRQKDDPFKSGERTCSNGWLIYKGPLDFHSEDPKNETTVAQWFASSGGVITDGHAPNLLLGKSPLASDPDTGTTTIISFLSLFDLPPSLYAIRHNDGVELQIGVDVAPENLRRQGGWPGPGPNPGTNIATSLGGRLALIYVAASGDPAHLVVVTQPR